MNSLSAELKIEELNLWLYNDPAPTAVGGRSPNGNYYKRWIQP